MSLLILALGAGLIAGGAFGNSRISHLESVASADLASRLDVKSGVKIDVEVDGVVGALCGRLSFAEISASGFGIDRLPILVEDGSKRGSIGSLRLRFRDFVIRGLPVVELSADIPGCRFDLGEASRGRIRLTRSGSGKAFARLSESGLAIYIAHKFPALKNVTVRLDKYKAFVEAEAAFMGAHGKLYVIADVVPRSTQLWLENCIVFFNDHRLRDGSGDRLVASLNPVVDEARDLGLGSSFDMQKVVSKGGFLTITGSAAIPKASDLDLPKQALP